jgi:dihydropteroate synthase
MSPSGVDTRKPVVMRAAIDAGAAMINDIFALREPGAIEACAASNVGVCLMHMQREPRTMQTAPSYVDVVTEVRDFLLARAGACLDAGIGRERIAIDPGFGFGKTLAHNLHCARAEDVLGDGPFLWSPDCSRKAIARGKITGQSVDERCPASLAPALSVSPRMGQPVRSSAPTVRETV